MYASKLPNAFATIRKALPYSMDAEAKHRPIQSVIYNLRRIVSSARIEELGDEVRGLAGFLDHREVSGIVDHGEPRSSDPSRSLLRRLPRELGVVAAGEDERG